MRVNVVMGDSDYVEFAGRLLGLSKMEVHVVNEFLKIGVPDGMPLITAATKKMVAKTLGMDDFNNLNTHLSRIAAKKCLTQDRRGIDPNAARLILGSKMEVVCQRKG